MLSTYVYVFTCIVVINFLIFLNPLWDILFLYSLVYFFLIFTAQSWTEIKNIHTNITYYTVFPNFRALCIVDKRKRMSLNTLCAKSLDIEANDQISRKNMVYTKRSSRCVWWKIGVKSNKHVYTSFLFSKFYVFSTILFAFRFLERKMDQNKSSFRWGRLKIPT